MQTPQRMVQVGSVIFDLNAVIHCSYYPTYHTREGIQFQSETILYFSGRPETDASLIFEGDEAELIWDLFKGRCLTLKPAPWEGKKEGNHAA